LVLAWVPGPEERGFDPRRAWERATRRYGPMTFTDATTTVGELRALIEAAYGERPD